MYTGAYLWDLASYGPAGVDLFCTLLCSPMREAKMTGAPPYLKDIIPWNCSCHWNWATLSSIEFHIIQWNSLWHWNRETHSFMEFHGVLLLFPISNLRWFLGIPYTLYPYRWSVLFTCFCFNISICVLAQDLSVLLIMHHNITQHTFSKTLELMLMKKWNSIELF